MSKKEQKQKWDNLLFDGMCELAETLYQWKEYGPSTGVEIIGDCPLPFKPGLGDKLLFKRIMQDHYHEIPKEVLDYGHVDMIGGAGRPICNARILGFLMLGQHYFNQYGWFDEKQLEEAKKE